MRPRLSRSFLIFGFSSSLLLGGCSGLPRSGPAAVDVALWNAGDKSLEKGYGVMVLDSTTVNVVNSYQPSYFPNEFRDMPIRGRGTKIGIGDQLKISIWEASGDGLFSTTDKKQTDIVSIVDNSGNIFIPYVGRIRAEQKTVESLRYSIEVALKTKAIEPQVQIQVTGEMGNSVVVIGDVVKPGRYPISTRGVRFLEMIAEAGGSRQATYETVATLKRGSKSGTVHIEDLIEHPSNDLWLAPGDNILISHKPRTYTAFGAVNTPQVVPFKTRSLTLADALAHVGGLRDLSADAGGVFLFRYEPADLVRSLRPALSGQKTAPIPIIYRLNFNEAQAFFLARSFKMKDQDIIYVANHPTAEFGKFLNIIMPLLIGIGNTRAIITP